jgi:small GTP-binding protein
MSELTECPICFERFNRTEKMPKILSCGHTFCKSCLIKQKNKFNQLSCPLCRESQKIDDPEQLITNRTVYDLLYNPTNEIGDDNDDNQNASSFEYKVIMIGPASSGKTSLVKRYITKEFSEIYNVTVGLDYQTKQIQIGKKIVNMSIWDTAGTEMFQSLSRSYYRKSHAAIVVFDINDEKSFESLETWINFYRENKEPLMKDMLYLVGNKIDIGKKVISDKEAKKYLKENDLKKYYKTSAKNGDNVDKLFEEIAKDLFENYKYIKNKSISIKLNGAEKKKRKKCKC